MDPIDLVRALPARMRAKIYAKALARVLFPDMPWPAWLSICGFGASALMVEAWKRLAPSLPALTASDVLLGIGMMLPALALDALLRNLLPARRTKLGYMAAPLLAVLVLGSWLALCEQPLARQQALGARAAEVSAQADMLLSSIQTRLAKDNAELAASEALRIGLGRQRNYEPVAKPTLLPPLPSPAGAFALTPGAAREQVAVTAAQNEDFERSARLASDLLANQARGDQAGLDELTRQSRGIATQLRRAPSPLSIGMAADPRQAFLVAVAAAWILAPLCALVGAYGLAASLCAPFVWAWSLFGLGARLVGRIMRPWAARLLAPEEADLAELHKMVKAYSDTQRALADDASMMGPILPVFDDLSVSFELSPRATESLHAREHSAEEATA
jgi:hypothetical protein